MSFTKDQELGFEGGTGNDPSGSVQPKSIFTIVPPANADWDGCSGSQRQDGPADSPEEACGVFGIKLENASVSHLTFDGLYALQHRGQESAGIAVSDGQGITVVKNMGLVSNVFDERTLLALPGGMAIGHTRYSTTGASNWKNAQPVFRAIGETGFALGHNGNLTNTADLVEEAGLLPGLSISDTDALAELLSRHFSKDPGPDSLKDALLMVLPMLKGAFSLVLMDLANLIAVRDPNGFRPLCLGRLGTGWVFASESPALDVIGAKFVRELEPGEMVVVSEGEPKSYFPFPPDRVDPKLCIFEFVYFARPDSRLLDREVHGTRRRMGQYLALTAPVEADMVMGVPDSGVPAAEGYALQSQIPYGQGLVKNRYIGRTFITPDPSQRANGVRRKLNTLTENIAGKRLVVVDDSIVRGTTTKAMVKLLREGGATEIHLRISSPPYKWSCFYGIDTPSRPDLLASTRTLDEIREYLNVDSIAYLDLADLRKAIGADYGFCDACLTGNYPVEVPVSILSAAAVGNRVC